MGVLHEGDSPDLVSLTAHAVPGADRPGFLEGDVRDVVLDDPGSKHVARLRFPVDVQGRDGAG